MQRVSPDALEHLAVVPVLGRVAVVDGLRPPSGLARADRSEKRALRLLVQVLRFVKDEQRTVLAVAPIARACEKLHPRAALEPDFFAPQRGADAVGSEELAQRLCVHELRHFLERLGRGLLQLRGVNHRAVIEQHFGRGAPLYAPRLAVLSRCLVAAGRRGPFAVGEHAHPRLKKERLPVHALEPRFGEQVERVQHVVRVALRHDDASWALVACCVG